VWLPALAAAAVTAVWSVPAHAAGPGQAAASLLGLLAIIVLLLAMGMAAGSFAMTVNHIFRRRSHVSFKVLCSRPGWSLLTGMVVTLLGMGLMALLRGAPPLQLLIMGAYLIGLALFAIAVAVRLAGRVLDPTTLDDELPDARLLLKGGLLLLAINAVPFIGTMLFAGILLAAVGATLLGYFTSRTGARRPLAPAAAPAAPVPATAAQTPGGEYSTAATESVATKSTSSREPDDLA
jgi:vacuolar-type H+-ATPase subunit I/STV1